MVMTANKPYFIRAVYEWIVDNNHTPYLLVNADDNSTIVPKEYINNGRIILNISPKACRGLHLENNRIVFTARFSGQTMQIFVHPKAVLAIYSKENGRGMEFDAGYDGEDTYFDEVNKTKSHAKPKLQLIKTEKLPKDEG
jgi:stringent starvation protein B